MGFIKKRLFLILCVVVLLFGLGLFTMGMMKASANQKELTQIATTVTGLDKLRGSLIHDDELEYYRSLADQAKLDADQIEKLARESSARALIYADVFPEIQGQQKDTTSARMWHYGKFAQNYTALVQDFIARMKAGDRPSPREEQQVIDEFKRGPGAEQAGQPAARSQPFGFGGPQRGQGSSDRRSYQSMDQQEERLIEDLRQQRAQQIQLYANAEAFCRYDYWDPADGSWKDDVDFKEVTQTDSWFTQVAAWIEEDVVAALADLNGDSSSVYESPVKRLVEISFGGATQRETSSKKDRATRDRSDTAGVIARRNPAYNLPEYVVDAENPLGTQKPSDDEPGIYNGQMVVSWTKHASNDLMHVVHFEVAVIVDTTRMDDFFNALQTPRVSSAGQNDQAGNIRNQIVVLDVNVQPVDVETEQQAGYYYGPASLALLRVICEYTFFKDGYESFMPEPVKQIFELEKPQEVKKTSREKRRGKARETRDKGSDLEE